MLRALRLALLIGAAVLPQAAAQTRDRAYVFRGAGSGTDEVLKAQVTDAEGNTYYAGDFRTQTFRFGGTWALTNAGSAAAKTADVFLAKVDATGQIGWVVGWGGAADDTVGALALDPTGSKLFVGGSFRSDFFKLNDAAGSTIERDDFWMNSPPGANAFLVAVDTRTGRPLDSMQIGEGDNDVNIRAMATDAANGRLVVAGDFGGFLLSPNGSGEGSIFLINTASDEPTTDPFVLAYDLATLNMVTGGQVGGLGDDLVTDVAVHPTTGEVFLAGNFDSDDFGMVDGSWPRLTTPAGTPSGYVLALTPELDTVTWGRTLGRGSKAAKIALDAAGDALYVEGLLTSQMMTGLNPATAPAGDVTVARLQASTGQPQWARALPAPSSLAFDAAKGQLFVLGGFTGQPTLGTGVSLRATTGQADVYVARLDAASGTPLGARSYGKGSRPSARFFPGVLTLDPAINAVVLSGQYTDGTIDVATTTQPQEPASMQVLLDVFVARTPMPAATATAPSPDAAAAAAAAAATAPLAQYGLRISGAGSDPVKGVAVDDTTGAAFVVGDFSSAFVTVGTRRLVNAGKTGNDIFLAKVARGGAVEWAYSWGGEDDDSVAAIALDPAGDGFYVAGNFKSLMFGMDDMTSILRGAGGSDPWETEYTGSWDDDGTFTWDDDGTDIAWDDDGTFMWDDDGAEAKIGLGGLGGNLAAPEAATEYDCFVAKVSGRGEVLWAQHIGEVDGDDLATALAATVDAVYVAGSFTSMLAPVGDSFVVNSGEEGSGSADSFWAAFGAETGETLGATSFANADQDEATDLVVDASARPEDYPALLVAGSYSGQDLIVASMVPNDEGVTLPAPPVGKDAAYLVMNGGMGPDDGGLAWAISLGPDSAIHHVALDAASRSVYAVGSFPSFANGGATPTFIKLDASTGAFVWSRVLPRAADVAVDILGFVYVTGVFKGPLSIAPSASVTSTNPNGDLYIAKFAPHDATGLRITAHGGSGLLLVGGRLPFNVQALEVDANGAVYLAGGYENSALVLGGATLANPGGSADGFLGRVWLQPAYAGATPRPTPAPGGEWKVMAVEEPGTARPTVAPTRTPTERPTTRPTNAPTTRPTSAPSTAPTDRPTAQTAAPTKAPTVAATPAPTEANTPPPTEAATAAATAAATEAQAAEAGATPDSGAKDQTATAAGAGSPSASSPGGALGNLPPAGSILSPEPKSETSETTETTSGPSSGAGNAPATATAGTGPQTLDLVLTYAGDAAKVGSLEQALYDLVKTHASSFKVGTPQAKKAAVTGRRRLLPQLQRFWRAAQITPTNDRCSDPTIPKLEIPFRVTAPDATAAAAVLQAFQQAAFGGKQLVRGGDVFDASVLCGIASTPAPTGTEPSALLSTAAIASLQELQPTPVAGTTTTPAAGSKDGTAAATTAPANEGPVKPPLPPPSKWRDPAATTPQSAGDTATAAPGGAGGSGGAIGGAVAGVLLVACAAAGFIFVRRRRLAAAAQEGGSQV